jgi:5-formyltetrahydrofolate cyclo-ligase
MPASDRERKQASREAVWARLDREGISTVPRPVRGRIPNVKQADAAAQRLAETSEWAGARVKVNPDPPQRAVRFRALRDGKVLLMPPPALRKGFLLLRIDPQRLAPNQLYAASSVKGAFAVGEPIGLDDLPAIDLLVFGSVAVSADGDRVGKGAGYAAIPREPFDVTLDLICTPTRTLRPAQRGPRPPGVLWDALPSERMDAMPVLGELRARLDDKSHG